MLLLTKTALTVNISILSMSGPYNYVQATQHSASLRPRARLICVYGGGEGVEWGAYISNLLMEEPVYRPNNILLSLQRKGSGHIYESLEKCRDTVRPWLNRRESARIHKWRWAAKLVARLLGACYGSSLG